MAVQESNKYQTQLRKLLVERLSMAEIKTLYFDLNVDSEILFGDEKSEKVIELITHLERRHRLPEIAEWIKKERPDLAKELESILEEWEILRKEGQPLHQKTNTYLMIGTILLMVVVILSVLLWKQQDVPRDFIYQARVRDAVTNSAVENAKVTIELSGDSILSPQYSDADGLVVFSIKAEYANSLARLFVEKTNYQTDTYSVNIVPERLPQEIRIQPIP